MAEIIQLMDGTETEEWLPVTNTAAVYDDDGNRLDNTLSSLTSTLANLSMKYNPTDDYIYLKDEDGNYVKWKKANLNSLVIFDGTWGDGFSSGTALAYYSNYTNRGLYSVANGYIDFPISSTSGTSYGGSVNGLIDLSDYNTFKMNYSNNGTEKVAEYDISSSTSKGYLTMTTRNNGSILTFTVYLVNPIGTYAETNRIVLLANDATLSDAHTYVSKIWLE